MNLNLAYEVYGVRSIVSSRLHDKILDCGARYREEVEGDTINMAKVIAEEVGRLTTLAAHVRSEDDHIQDMIPAAHLREYVEYAAAYGTLVLTPTGDVYIPEIDCILTNSAGTAAVFFDHYAAFSDGEEYHYTRLEYHRFVNGVYQISNRAIMSKSENGTGVPVPLAATDWADLSEETYVENLEEPLYAILKAPGVNNIDLHSPLGLPAYSNALNELDTLDIAYFKNSEEIAESGRIVIMDADRLIPAGKRIANIGSSFRDRAKNLRLPKYVRGIFGMGGDHEIYHEINPALNTETRLKGIDHELSVIGFKCGFSSGYFVLDQKTGMVTATQVEADDRRTIQLIKDWRDKLQQAIDRLIRAICAIEGEHEEPELVYDFGDITYNYAEDKATWWRYRIQGDIPAWLYYTKWEGMTEEQAKAMVQEARTEAKSPTLFSSFQEE